MAEDERGMKERDTSRQILGDTADIVRKTKANEIRSTFRVYVKEPVLVYSAPTPEDVGAYYTRKFEGRVHPQDAVVSHCEELGVHQLRLSLWNVKAEWKDEAVADAHREELLKESDTPCEVVVRNSRREHVLTSYGKLKLAQSS